MSKDAAFPARWFGGARPVLIILLIMASGALLPNRGKVFHSQLQDDVAGQADAARKRLQELGFAYSTLDFLKSARVGDIEGVKAFLDAGMNPNVSERGRTSLMEAAGAGQVSITQMLLARGAIVDQGNDMGVTALAEAAGRGKTPVVRELIRAGASLDSKHMYGYTPLIWAALMGNIDCVEVLVQAGSAIELRD